MYKTLNRLLPYPIGLILLLLPLLAFTQQGKTIISGKHTSYAGDTLIFYSYSDWLTRVDEKIATVPVDAEGNFRLELDKPGVFMLFTELGIYRGSLLAQAGKSYSVILPPLIKKTQAQQLNPFFQPVEIILGVNNEDANSVFRQIDGVDNAIDSFIQVHQFDLQSKKAIRQSFNQFKKTQQAKVEHKYALGYQDYRIAQLEQFFYHYPKKKLLEEFLLNKVVLYENQAYMDFLHLEFRNELSSLLPGNCEAMQSKNLGSIRNKVDSVLNNSDPVFRDLWIIKGLYDGFYDGSYRAAEVLPVLQVLETDPQLEIGLRRMVSNSIRQITTLLPGYPAPGFNLRDQSGFDFYLETFKGKYLYLSFVSKDSYVFRQDIEILKLLQKRFTRNLEIVTISVDEDFTAFLDYMDQQSCRWIFLNLDKQRDLLKQYKVRTFPSYYLIDPYGNVILAPAPSPQENFENELFRILNRRS